MRNTSNKDTKRYFSFHSNNFHTFFRETYSKKQKGPFSNQVLGKKKLVDSDGGIYKCEGYLGGVTVSAVKELIIKGLF